MSHKKSNLCWQIPSLLTRQVERYFEVSLSVAKPAGEGWSGEQPDGQGRHEVAPAPRQSIVSDLTPTDHGHERAPEPSVEAEHDDVTNLTRFVFEELGEKALKRDRDFIL